MIICCRQLSTCTWLWGTTTTAYVVPGRIPFASSTELWGRAVRAPASVPTSSVSTSVSARLRAAVSSTPALNQQLLPVFFVHRCRRPDFIRRVGPVRRNWSCSKGTRYDPVLVHSGANLAPWRHLHLDRWQVFINLICWEMGIVRPSAAAFRQVIAVAFVYHLDVIRS